ncbi:PREDICTED: mono [ADP-ribose] polymerase PARP16 [Thamnophis sirtalis]|uniref:Mono [ADP-ribose] polymerase PARP16 n=1 Tax=Thamnophis sirtalis TaxID=35019 RepID=A0A6I9YXB4_9SAUR|nr:PREDICTED: mono [ADP-ribose] polymerase PARP16 [Thamnophis sirtalis]
MILEGKRCAASNSEQVASPGQRRWGSPERGGGREKGDPGPPQGDEDPGRQPARFGKGLLGMPAPSHNSAAPTAEGVREIIQKDLLAADLKCSLFASALQSYKRDSVLRPFPGHYSSEDSKDFEALTSLFGEGTYLTSDLSLALLYSPHSLGWQRSAMGPILSCVAVCEVIDHPDVKCQVKKKDSKEIDRKRARVKNSEGGDVPQKYFVVTNNQLIRVKYLLIYSQRQHRRLSGQSWLSKHRFAVMMTLYLLLLVIIGTSNSPAFLYYWNRIFDFKQ